MKYGILLALLLAFLYSEVFAQGESMNEFKAGLFNELQVEYNINSLPDSFYQCAYYLYLKAEDDKYYFDIGYRIGKECLLTYIDQVGFSDGGLKLLKDFKDAFVNGCTTANQVYREAIYVGPFCVCLYEEYLKYEIGYELLTDPEFANTILSEKIATYCLSIYQRTQ